MDMLPGFNVISSLRNERGGGVLIAVSKDMEVIHDLTDKYLARTHLLV